MINIFIRKCRSAVWHAQNGYEQWQNNRIERRKVRVASKWIESVTKFPPQVMVGANFVDLGGTRMHMHSIQKYSALNVNLAPNEDVMTKLTPNEFMDRVSGDFNRIDTSKYLAVHSHVFPFFIKWCQRAKQAHGTRWIHTHHNWYYPEFGKNGIEPWQDEFNQYFLLAAAEADVCLCVSRGQQTFLKEKFGLNTHHLPNGVDIAACENGSSSRWTETTGIQPGFILFVGRNDPVKDPEFFVKLAAKMPKQRFVIAGQGISRDVIKTEWQLEIPNNLDVLGQLTHSQVQDAIAASGVLILCSKREGLPTLVLEGMVAQKPVVVPNETGCMEAIGQGEFGFIYTSNDFDDCIAKLELALHNHTVPKLARSYATATYSWHSILRKLDSIYVGGDPELVLRN